MAEYIEREAFAAELAKGTIFPEDLYDMGIMAGVKATMKKLKDFPAADVAPVVHGRWICVGDVCIDGEYEDILRCSQCRIPNGRKSRYCPCCGARMDGE